MDLKQLLSDDAQPVETTTYETPYGDVTLGPATHAGNRQRIYPRRGGWAHVVYLQAGEHSSIPTWKRERQYPSGAGGAS